MGSITDATILHHVCIVLVFLWILNSFNYSHPISYFLSLIYLYLVHEGYVSKLKRKLQFEERRDSMKTRVLSDSETVRWLNYAIEKMWLICMEDIVSQKILLPIVPWFLQKYKPWTVKDTEVQHLYLGRSPPIFTEMRVLPHSNGDDHLVLELGMSFRTADDMSAILAVKLKRRLGFGMWAKLHLLGLHVEGKVLVGVKFLRRWPFIGRLRVCFSGPPYFQMTVKPIFTHGLDVTEVPGIAGWIDNLLALVFEQTLVEPNMLVVDVEKFVSPQPENWFSVDAKEPIAHAIVEIIEAAEMNPSDLNGLADPYVKGQLGSFRFRTKIQKKTLAPIWQEEFKIPISTWESENVLAIEVRDKDHLFDDMMGDCSVNINGLRDGQRHDIWLPLQNIKMGRLHLAVTVLEDNKKEAEPSPDEGDKFEPINIEGQSETGIWIHHPGNEVAQLWEPRKGKTRHLDIHHLNCEVNSETINSARSFKSVPPISIPTDGSSTDENCGTSKSDSNTSVRRGLKKIGSMFHKTPRPESKLDFLRELEPSPCDNIRAVNNKEVGVKLIVDDVTVAPRQSPREDGHLFVNESGLESPGNVKGVAKSMLIKAGKTARNLKVVLSRKASRKFQVDNAFTPTNKESHWEPNSSVSSTEVAPSLATNSGNSSFRSGDSKTASPRDGYIQSPKQEHEKHRQKVTTRTDLE